MTVRKVSREHGSVIRDADEFEQSQTALDRRALFPAVPWHAQQCPKDARAVAGVETHHDVLERGHLAEQTDVLEGTREPKAGDLVTLATEHRLSLEQNLAACRLVDPGHCVEAGGLASTIRTDQSEDLATLDVKRDIVEGDEAAEFHGQVFDLHDVLAEVDGDVALRRRGFGHRSINVNLDVEGGHGRPLHRNAALLRRHRAAPLPATRW